MMTELMTSVLHYSLLVRKLLNGLENGFRYFWGYLLTHCACFRIEQNGVFAVVLSPKASPT